MEGIPNLHEKLDAGVARRPEYGPLSLDLDAREFSIAGAEKPIHLEPKEYQILWLLVRAQGNTLTEAEIVDFIYGDMSDVKDAPLSNTIPATITKVRNKLESVPGNRIEIRNKIGLGYSLEINPEPAS
ncbi:MAG: hypothetical protein AB203_03185 [Parcubacteria bacterium C7867-008]|nr:MAG: hypothetical protein AB203_03185 [Parcubacteria bacterium C7867-008]